MVLIRCHMLRGFRAGYHSSEVLVFFCVLLVERLTLYNTIPSVTTICCRLIFAKYTHCII